MSISSVSIHFIHKRPFRCFAPPPHLPARQEFRKGKEKERKKGKGREEGDKSSGEWVPGRKVTDVID